MDHARWMMRDTQRCSDLGGAWDNTGKKLQHTLHLLFLLLQSRIHFNNNISVQKPSSGYLHGWRSLYSDFVIKIHSWLRVRWAVRESFYLKKLLAENCRTRQENHWTDIWKGPIFFYSYRVGLSSSRPNTPLSPASRGNQGWERKIDSLMYYA